MSVADVLIELGLAAEYAESAPPDPGCPDQTFPLPDEEHEFFRHTPLWNWVNPVLKSPFAKERGEAVLFEDLDPSLTPEEYAGHTNLFVFIGAHPSTALDFALSRPDVLTLVFEPDCERFRAFARTLDPAAAARSNVLFFSGDFMELMPYISEKLTRTINRSLFPIFFIGQAMEKAYGGFAARVAEQVEILYYRACIYPIEGHWGGSSLPLRDITRDLFYDQLKHLYQNLTGYVTCGKLDALRGILPGKTAVLVAPGPDLDHRIDYLRECERRGAVIIAVTRALPTLLEHGIEPHFALINDNSIEAGTKVLDLLPEMKKTVLVAQCLSPTGSGVFKKIYFFGNILENIFPKRAELRLHGSVITTCYSLAAFLGCARCVLVGAQLAGHNRESWKLSYSKKGGLEKDDLTVDEPEGSWPYLYPVASSSGREMYTTINFLDAAIWLREEIRRVGLPVVNTTTESIIFGPGVTMDRDWLPPEEESPDPVVTALEPAGSPELLDKVEEFVAAQARMWTNTRKAANKMCRKLAETRETDEAMELLGTFDRNNTSYLLERYRTAAPLNYQEHSGQAEIDLPEGTPFSARDFYDLLFEPESPLSRSTEKWYDDHEAPFISGLYYYFTLCADMAGSLASILAGQRKKIREMRRGEVS